jgi:phage N-6-adenine-methyltransferase
MQLPLFESSTPYPSKRTSKRNAAPSRILSYEAARNNWHTPREIVERAIHTLGAIDLDPCSSEAQDVPAREHYTTEDNSLTRSWHGRVFLNPPHGRAISHWIDKLYAEYETGDVLSAIVLVPERTDTQWWQERLSGYPYCAIRGKVNFVREDGKKVQPTFPSAVVYLGPMLTRFVSAFGDIGIIYTPFSVNVVDAAGR